MLFIFIYFYFFLIYDWHCSVRKGGVAFLLYSSQKNVFWEGLIFRIDMLEHEHSLHLYSPELLLLQGTYQITPFVDLCD